MIFYLTDDTKTNRDGIFAIGCNPFSASLEMEFVQRIFFRDQLAHPYLQVIFAFDTEIDLPFSLIRNISIAIGYCLLYDRRQLLGAIHFLDKPNMIHCHYLINFVGIDGSLYRQKYSLRHYKTYINDLLNLHNLNPIKINLDDTSYITN